MGDLHINTGSKHLILKYMYVVLVDSILRGEISQKQELIHNS